MTRLFRNSSLFFTLSLIALTSSPASAALVETGAASVSFVAVGPAGLKIIGKGSSIKLSDDSKFVSLVLPLDTLETGIGLRDHHMKDKYLETAKFPLATLKVDRKQLQLPAAGGKSSHDAQGDLTLHGKTKHVSFHYVAQATGSGFKVDGTLHVNMTDFGIEAPSYLGMTVKPDVAIEVQLNVAGN